MSRTDDEILQSLKESLRATDPSVDTVKGPVFDFLLSPVPPELQKTEADAERVAILSTVQLEEVATEEEVTALATSFSIRLGGGKASKTKNQIFYSYSRPETDVVIDRGYLVGTLDQTYTYFVSRKATIPASSPDNFYNPETRRYEVAVECEATAVGPDFDLPPNLVRKIITPIDGIDGTVNTGEYTGGEESESLSNSVDRIRAKLAGLDPETGGGIISDIRNFDAENVLDVALVYPKDRKLFKRPINRPAVDAHVLGDQSGTEEQIYVATGGETQIEIDRRPVNSISTVTINGVNSTFSLIKDETRESGGSPRAADFVLLDSALSVADTVVIIYEYNQLVYDIQDDLFGLDRPFDTDVLAREPREIGLAIEIDAVVVATFDTARVYSELQASLFELIETEFYVDFLLPEVIRQTLLDEVGGLSLLRIVTFKRTSGSVLEVEPVDLEKNEIAIIDQTLLKINVRR